MYTTKEKIRERLPLVTHSVRNDDVLDDIILQADSYVKVYLQSSYKLPLTKPYDSLVEYLALEYAVSLALYNVWGEGTDAHKESVDIANRVTNILSQIKEGKININHKKST